MSTIIALLAAMSFKTGLVTCQTGVLPNTIFKATLDLTDNRMEFVDAPDGLTVNGHATHSSVGGSEYYQLTYGFGIGVQLFFDGGEWWLCQAQDQCLRCGQLLTP